MIFQFSDDFRCKRRCSDKILFICGSDGNTYLNECNFNNARCENPKLIKEYIGCLLYTSPSPRDKRQSRMPSSA